MATECPRCGEEYIARVVLENTWGFSRNITDYKRLCVSDEKIDVTGYGGQGNPPERYGRELRAYFHE